MPPKHGGGAGRSSYVLVLREHDEEGSGYSLELAPLAAGDAPPRAGGRASTRAEAEAEAEAEAAAAAAATSAGTGSRVQGGFQKREEVPGGAPSRAQGVASSREVAATTTSRDGGDSPAKEAATAGSRPRRPRGSHARAPDSAVDVAVGGPHSGDGGVSGGRDFTVQVGDDEGDRILREMRAMLFSQPEQSEDTNSNQKARRERQVLIPVFLSPEKKGKKDDVWNKRQIMYGMALVGFLGFIPAMVALLPQWTLLVFAAIWGFSSIGFPFGLYGTSKFETSYSRHMGRLVFMGFCLFVIFLLYQYMKQPIDQLLTIGFATVGGIVMVGHIASWVTGCMTGSDKDEVSEFSGDDDMETSDLLQRFLGSH